MRRAQQPLPPPLPSLPCLDCLLPPLQCGYQPSHHCHQPLQWVPLLQRACKTTNYFIRVTKVYQEHSGCWSLLPFNLCLPNRSPHIKLPEKIALNLLEKGSQSLKYCDHSCNYKAQMSTCKKRNWKWQVTEVSSELICMYSHINVWTKGTQELQLSLL